MREREKYEPSRGPAPDIGNLSLRCQSLCSLIPARLYLTSTNHLPVHGNLVPQETTPVISSLYLNSVHIDTHSNHERATIPAHSKHFARNGSMALTTERSNG